MDNLKLIDKTMNLEAVSVVNFPDGFKITEIFFRDPEFAIKNNINPMAHVCLEKENDNTLTEYIFVQDINADIWCYNYLIPLDKLEDWESWLVNWKLRYDDDTPPPYCIPIDNKKLIITNYRLE